MSEKPYKYKCIGGSCPLKRNCVTHLIGRNSAEWIMRPPFKTKGKDVFCEHYNESYADKLINDLKIDPIREPEKN